MKNQWSAGTMSRANHMIYPPTVTEVEAIFFFPCSIRHRDRVCRIHLRMLRRLIAATEKGLPMLEYLYIGPLTEQNTILPHPSTPRAPIHAISCCPNLPFRSDVYCLWALSCPHLKISNHLPTLVGVASRKDLLGSLRTYPMQRHWTTLFYYFYFSFGGS